MSSSHPSDQVLRKKNQEYFIKEKRIDSRITRKEKISVETKKSESDKRQC